MTKTSGIKDLAIGRSDLYRIDPRELKIKPGWNARDTDFDPTDEEDLALAHSIAENGVREPLTAIWEDGNLYVTNGHRRRAATMYVIETLGVDVKHVPVQTEPRFSSEADHVLSQIVRNSGKALKPFEQGRVFKRLLDLGWTVKEVSTKTGLSTNHVTHLLELQSAPEAVTSFVRSGEVAASTAIKALKKNKGNTSKAASDLKQAVETAKASGKARATPKHLPERKSFKDQVREVVERATVNYGAGENDIVSLTFSGSDHADLKALLGIREPEEII